MDGTLTVPVLDFALMRRRAGVGPTGDILDTIAGWPEEEQQRARAAIAEVEEEALANMKLMPGLVELCAKLDALGVPRGLITRNVLASVSHFHDHHLAKVQPPLLPFSPAISRECAFAYKPSPEALLHICQQWGVPPAEAIMIGDSAPDDVVCGRRAGAVTVLLDIQQRYNEGNLGGEQRPDYKVASLDEASSLLSEVFDLRPPSVTAAP